MILLLYYSMIGTKLARMTSIGHAVTDTLVTAVLVTVMF